MRLIATLLFAAVISLTSPAQSLSSLLKGLSGSKSDTTATTGSTGSKAKDAFSAIAGAVTGGISSKDITGVWNYSGPAVTFKSENMLMKLGGAAGSSAVESKLKPIYQKAGLDNMTLTIAPDSTFTMKTKKISLKGTIDYTDDAIIMHFKALGKINIGKMEASVSGLTSKTLKLTFDVSKLTKILSAVSSVAGSQAASLTSLLEKYDGIQAGFALTKTADYTEESK